jgi:hypothetical protein
MNLPKLKANPKIWLIILPLLILATLLTFFYFQSPLQVTSTDPLNLATNVALYSPLEITFSQQLDPNQLPQINLDPQIEGQATLSSDSLTLTFTPTHSYQEQTTYQVSVTLPPRLNYTFSFTTKPPPTPRPAPRIEPRLQQIKDQLLNQLPAKFPGYTISYNSRLDLFHVDIHNQPVDYIKQQALEFFQASGFSDPTHQLKIFFNVPRVLDPPLPGFPTLTPVPSPTPAINPFIGP